MVYDLILITYLYIIIINIELLIDVLLGKKQTVKHIKFDIIFY